MRALVLNGGVKSALTVVRSLGKRGIPVTVGAERRTGMALWSRYATRTFVYRSPINDPAGFLDDVETAARAEPEPPIVYCMSDAVVLLLSRNRARFSSICVLMLPSEASMELAADKEATRALAESLKIPTPPSASFSLFPVVVKPRHSAVWKGGLGMTGTAQFAFSESEARAVSERIQSDTGEAPLIQEFVRGAEFGYEALCEKGTVIAFVMHRRMRSLSPTGGAAVIKITMEPDHAMQAHAELILKQLEWTGVAMVEFKQDEVKGVPYLLEINPRFWGSLPLALHAGVDFPFLYALCASGTPEHARALAATGYERRVISRHFMGDVRHVTRVLFARDRMRSIIYPGRLRALIDFLAPGFSMRHDVFDVWDPLPFFMEAVDHIA
jgi:predicted ATP-grasp superfamily ATP-dependent carboligase